MGTEPSRARSLQAFAPILEPPELYLNGTPAPLPEEPGTYQIPTDGVDPILLRWPFNLDNAGGGYKTQGLIGLHVSAPYLHDGGVAAGPAALIRTQAGWRPGDPTQLGMAGTLLRGIPADPANSLLVLIDRELRAKATQQNRASERLQRAHVTGQGHPYWVDAPAGYDRRHQIDLVKFLLSPIPLP